MIFKEIFKYLEYRKFPKIPLRELKFEIHSEYYGEIARETKRYVEGTMHIEDPVQQGALVSRNGADGGIVYMILGTKNQQEKEMRSEDPKATATIYPIGRLKYNPAAKKHCKKNPMKPFPKNARITLEELS